MISTENYGLHQQAEREKRQVALSSVLAAVFLTALKLVVGWITGSLGILAEAAHSGLDLVAAVVTFFAVRVSGRPADREHTYGHGKVENLSALVETLLLLLTCVWIIYEAAQRLFFKTVEVEASVWAFLVMGATVVVDLLISRALTRAAREHNSQALEADGLHFSTDVWSAGVVILGLVLVRLSEWLGLAWLAKGDALAALVVAGVVVYVSLQLGQRAVAGLLDEIPAGTRDAVIGAIRQVPGVLEIKRVRIRRSGPETFADVTLTVGRDTHFERTHEIASLVEAAVWKVVPGADVVVHVEPVRSTNEGLLTAVRLLAARHGLGAHGIRIYDLGGNHSLELHLEVDDSLQLDEAHQRATAFEQALRETLPQMNNIITHIEPVGDNTALRRATPEDELRVLQALRDLSEEAGICCDPHEVTVNRVGGELSVTFHCVMDGNTSIADAHTITEQVEGLLRSRMPDLGRVVIHVEPLDASG